MAGFSFTRKPYGLAVVDAGRYFYGDGTLLYLPSGSAAFAALFYYDLTLAGTLSGVEMGLRLFGMDNAKGGVDAALEYLADQAGA